MATCPKCNKELSDGAKFCGGCGAQIFETIFCPNCGKQTSTEFASCQSCGASITETPTEEQPAAAPTEKKKLTKKAIMFGGIGVVVVAVLILVISLFSGGGGKGENNYALYLKDNEIFFTDLKKGSEAWQLTSRLFDADADDVDDDLSDIGYFLGLYTRMSEDGKYVFFIDKVRKDNLGFNLYYREVAKPDAEPIKIDSDILFFYVNTSATLVTYLKGEEGNLYQYKISEDSKEKIASEVSDYAVSDDGNKFVYINSENSIYLKYADKEKEKIASNVSDLEHVTEDFTTVYYHKDGSLYKQVEGADKVKIASDVYDVIKIYDSGEIYYLTNEVEEISVTDYVTDDMKDADASITEPNYPDYPNAPGRPYFWDYDTNNEYFAAKNAYEQAYAEYKAECDRLYAEYEAAYEAYYAKLSRDELRKDIEKGTLKLSSHSLCFYNGKEEIVITDAFVGEDFSAYTYASDAPVIIYEACNQSSLEKVKLSEVESIYDIENMVEAALLSSSERYIAVKGTATVVEQEKEATNFTINSPGTIVYYIDDIPNEKNYGELYRISITGGVVGKAEVYDSDVCTDYCNFVSDIEFKYFKDCEDDKGELYINKNKIDYDVEAYYVEVYSDLGKVFYFIDWNYEEDYGTLKVYNGEESVKIADDVHSFSITPDGRVLYLDDYSLNYYKGELHEWSNGETRKIDDDVVCIIPSIKKIYQDLNRYRMVDLSAEPASVAADWTVAVDWSRPAQAEDPAEALAPSTDENFSASMTQEQQTEWLKQIQALAYIAYGNMRGEGKAAPEKLLANPDDLRMYIYASTDYLFYDAWEKYDWDEAKRLTAFRDVFGAECIAEDYEAYDAYIPENAIKDKLRNVFGSAAVEGFNFAGVFENGFFYYMEGDSDDYFALSECEETNWNDMSQIAFSYKYGYAGEDSDDTFGNIIISTKADTTSPYGCVVRQIEWSK